MYIRKFGRSKNEDPKVYAMSMCDAYTKERDGHLRRRHPQSTMSSFEIYDFESTGNNIQKARQKYYDTNENNAKQGPKVQ